MGDLRKVLNTSLVHKELIEKMKDIDALGFKLASVTDIYLLAMSLGLDNPQKLTKKDTYLRTEYISKAKTKALFECVPIGTVTDDRELDKYSDLESCLDLCEECAETGFQKLAEMLYDADYDRELFEKDIWANLDMLYKKTVSE